MPSPASLNPRELHRRQFQAVAASALDRQAMAIGATREVLADLAQRLDVLEGRQRRGFWGRLRWLVLGR
jgi:hypothetical protein